MVLCDQLSSMYPVVCSSPSERIFTADKPRFDESTTLLSRVMSYGMYLSLHGCNERGEKIRPSRTSDRPCWPC